MRPKAYRAVLMDQDVAHRLSTPSAAANRPRYSLVWKLVMVPRQQQQQQQQVVGATPRQVACIARSEWGQPTYFGSAAHVLRMAKQAAGSGAAAAGGATGTVVDVADGSDPDLPAAKKMRHINV